MVAAQLFVFDDFCSSKISKTKTYPVVWRSYRYPCSPLPIRRPGKDYIEPGEGWAKHFFEPFPLSEKAPALWVGNWFLIHG